MSFRCNNNHVELYRNNVKSDELILGAIPLKLIKWTDERIYLKASGEKKYLDIWLQKPQNKKSGIFILSGFINNTLNCL